jgi:hypothetical protein
VEFIRGSLAKKRGNRCWNLDNVDSGFDIDERGNPDSSQTCAGQDSFAACKPPVFDLVLDTDKLHGFIIFHRLDKPTYRLVNIRVRSCFTKFFSAGTVEVR